MKFLKLFNNRVLRKFCFWALLGLLICLVGISKPKADIVQYKFIDYESTSATMKQTSYGAYEDYTYPRDYVLFNGNDKFLLSIIVLLVLLILVFLMTSRVLLN